MKQTLKQSWQRLKQWEEERKPVGGGDAPIRCLPTANRTQTEEEKEEVNETSGDASCD